MFKIYLPFYRQNLKLAAPIVLAQGGQMLVAMADTLMVAKVGKTQVAAIAFVNTIYITLLVALFGFSMACTTLVGASNGEGDKKTADSVYQNSIRINLMISIVLTTIMLFFYPFMAYMGQPEEVIESCSGYYFYMVATFVPFAVFCSGKFYVEGLEKPAIATYYTFVSNLLNVALNYVFIFGHFGFPAMGLSGAGFATLISRIVQTVGIWIHIKLVFNPKGKLEYKILRRLFVLGVPISLVMIYEVIAFSAGALMMGWLGENELAAHQIVITVAGLTYLMATGVGGAATIANSNELGRRDWQKINLQSWASWHIVVVFMSFTAMVFISFRKVIPSLFVLDAQVIAIAAQLFVFAGLFQIFDGIQAVGQGILRGMADVKVPSFLAFVGYFLVLIPASYVFAFWAGWGAVGVWLGYLFGLILVSILLVVRYKWLVLRLKKDWSQLL